MFVCRNHTQTWQHIDRNDMEFRTEISKEFQTYACESVHSWPKPVINDKSFIILSGTLLLVLKSGKILSLHRISAGGSLLFMRCVFLTLTGLISAWQRGEASSAILAKPLSDCVTVLCLGQCKSRHLDVWGILKMTRYFQANWIFYSLQYLT